MNDQARGQVRNVRERTTRTDRERRQHRKDLIAEPTWQHVRPNARLITGDDPDPVPRQRGTDDITKRGSVTAVLATHAVGDTHERLGR